MKRQYLEISAYGFEFDVYGEYIPAERGRREQGLQMEPDYPADFEIESICLAGSEDDLSEILAKPVIETIHSLCCERVERDLDDAIADAAEQRREQMRDDEIMRMEWGGMDK